MRRLVCFIGVGALGLLGCGGYTNKDLDLDRHPIVVTGVGGTIIMPGDHGVPMAGAHPQMGLGPPPPGAGSGTASGASGPGGASGSSSSTGTGQPAGGRGGITMIGSADQDIEAHRKINNEPAWAKVAKLPFLIAAYPFKKAHQAVTGRADPTVKVSGPPPAAPPTPAQLQAQREQALLEGMASELEQQSGPPGPAPAPGHSAAAPVYREPMPTAQHTPTSAAAPSSIAQELAALRRSMQSRATAPTTTPPEVDAQRDSATPSAPVTRAVPAPEPIRLYETMDRDADGRPDRWVYRQGRKVVAEATDEDGDGLAERKVEFVPGSDAIAREEEDTNADGRADTFTEYDAGVIARRETDSNADGVVDVFSIYDEGELLRNESDTNADGFRDRMAFYEDGRLVREEEDRDGNGRPDRITHYDDQERKRLQEEDTDRDGEMDIRSFYREGKLRRRELIR